MSAWKLLSLQVLETLLPLFLVLSLSFLALQSQNKLIITHIVVPKQKGKSDSCETLCEEELFDVQDRYDLITLGWIHVSALLIQAS